MWRDQKGQFVNIEMTVFFYNPPPPSPGSFSLIGSVTLNNVFLNKAMKHYHSLLELCFLFFMIRRLLPASSILLRDITALDVEDEIEKPKVSGWYE